MGHHDLIILTFREPLRGRELRPGYVPSDRLWGALYATDARLQDQPMPTDNPYRVSSAFPYAGGEWLLPKPRTTSAGTLEDGPGDRKAVKRLEYVNLADVLTLATGQRLSAERLAQAASRQRRALLPVSAGDLPVEIDESTLNRALRGTRHAGQVDGLARTRYGAPVAHLTSSERLHLSRDARGRGAAGVLERQRNTQDRITQATDTFTTSGLTSPRVAFLLETTSGHQRTRLLAALRLLADAGLGGMRTQASGQFTFDIQPVPKDLETHLGAAGAHILLGLARPTADEVQWIEQAMESRYTLLRRDGFLDGTALQRQDVWMLAEGSVVPGALNGSLADVAPPGYAHPVWRSGLAVSLGVGT